LGIRGRNSRLTARFGQMSPQTRAKNVIKLASLDAFDAHRAGLISGRVGRARQVPGWGAKSNVEENAKLRGQMIKETQQQELKYHDDVYTQDARRAGDRGLTSQRRTAGQRMQNVERLLGEFKRIPRAQLTPSQVVLKERLQKELVDLFKTNQRVKQGLRQGYEEAVGSKGKRDSLGRVLKYSSTKAGNVMRTIDGKERSVYTSDSGRRRLRETVGHATGKQYLTFVKGSIESGAHLTNRLKGTLPAGNARPTQSLPNRGPLPSQYMSPAVREMIEKRRAAIAREQSKSQ